MCLKELVDEIEDRTLVQCIVLMDRPRKRCVNYEILNGVLILIFQ